MRRLTTTPRANWEQKVSEAGLTWHTGEQIYWNEAAYYEFTAKEVPFAIGLANVIDARMKPKKPLTLDEAAMRELASALRQFSESSGERRAVLIVSH